MLNKRIFKITICLACAVFALSAISACGKAGQRQDAQLQALEEAQKQEKESEKLKKIESGIEDLFDVLGGPSVKTKGSKDKEGGEEQKSETTKEKTGQQQTTQQQTGQQQVTQKQGGQGGQGQQKKEQQKEEEKKSDKKWSEVEKIINSLHYQWNDFMPEIAKKGADIKLIDNFDSALNNLTTTVSAKETEKVLIAANALYSHIPDLYSIYRAKLSPEAKRMIYYARSIILESARDNWEKVEKDNNAMEKSWSLFRNTLEIEQQKIGDKLNFSIYELKKVIGDRDKQLTDIKGKIVLNNIKELQKSFEDSG